jgi:hypothetical protein
MRREAIKVKKIASHQYTENVLQETGQVEQQSPKLLAPFSLT